jgi:hypothetical protein
MNPNKIKYFIFNNYQINKIIMILPKIIYYKQHLNA